MSAPFPENIEDAYPLSPLQQGMVFHSVNSPGSGVYIEQISLTIEQPDFAPEVFKNCWETLIERHGVFRTAFIWKDLEEPLQVVRKKVKLPWKEVDIRDEHRSAQQAVLTRLMREDLDNEFGLNRAPLMRMILARTGEEQYRWIWTRHHLIADGWSTNNVLRELKQLYRAEITGKSTELEDAPRYRNFIAWLKQRDGDRDRQFWQNYLDGIQHHTVLGIEKHRASAHRLGQFEEASCQLSVQATSALQALCRSLRLTPNVAVQAAWSILLGRYSGNNDVVWGATFSGRPTSLHGVEKTVGLFINTLPMRTKINWKQSIGEFLQGLQKNQRALMEYENTALSKIIHWSGCPAGEPLFQSVVVYENYPVDSANSKENEEPATLRLSDIEYKEQSDLPLALIVLPESELRLILIYDASVFESRQIDRILAQMEFILSGMPKHPVAPLSTLSILPPEEKNTLFRHWNNTDLDINSDRFIDQLILERAAAQPNALAIVCGENRLNYEELAQGSQVFLSNLLSRRIGPGNIVGICLSRDVEALVWMLAVLRSGAAYLMLDPEYPSARLQEMLARSSASLIITDRIHEPKFTSAACPVLLTNKAQPCKESTDPDHPYSGPRSSSDTAYVLFTSGSTGIPKGVMISHQNLTHSTTARSHVYSDPPVAFLLLSSFSFDSSVAGIFWTLVNGGKLVISRPRQEQNVDNLLATISAEKITHTLCLPSLYRSIIDHVAATQNAQPLSSLKLVVNAGEVMPSGEYLELHRSLLPQARICNEYGPTEATVWCAVYDATEHDSTLPIPIGKPIANTKAYVLDKNGEPVPIGAAGELAVSGKNLSRGYLNDELATQDAFRVSSAVDNGRTILYHTGDLVKYREDGNLLFLGRSDEQIKVRGHRIEPREIETRILAFPGVLAAAVIAHRYGNQSTRLMAFVVTESSHIEVSDIHDSLVDQVPDYLIPSGIVVLEHLPLLANGKLDRQALDSLANQQDHSLQADKAALLPKNEIQSLLVEIWKDVLGTENVSVDANFFNLGGDSILSIRMVSKILQAGFDVGPNDIFDAPTIEKLSAKIEKSISAPQEAPVLSKEGQDRARREFGDTATAAFPLTETQSAFLFAYLSRGNADPGHMQIQAQIEGNLDVALLKQCISEIVSRHDALRSTIHWRGKTEPEQVVFSNSRVDIVFRDLQQENASKAIDFQLVADRNQPLNLDKYPSWRIYLFQLGACEHLLCWTLHHSLVDGWSASIVLQEVMEVYHAKLESVPPVISESPQFISYQRWLLESNTRQLAEYWKRLLDPFNSSRDNIPVLETASNETQQLMLCEFSISDKNLELLQHHLQKQQITFAQLLQSAWGICLSAASYTDHLAFFTTVSGRAAPLQGIDKMVGQFVNHLPIVVKKQNQDGLSNILRQIKKQSSSFREHDHIPPNVLLNWCKGPIDCVVRTDDGPVGIQSLVMMENFPWQQEQHTDHPNSVVLSSLQRRGRSERFSLAGISSNFPLTLVGTPEDQSTTVTLYYVSTKFNAEKAKILMDKLKYFLEGLNTAESDLYIAELRNASRSFFNIERPELTEKPKRNKGFVGNNAIEKSIAAIWQEVLGKQVDHVDQSFFDLGGNSMAAVRVAESVERLLNVKMPIALLIEHNTVQRLAEILQRKTNNTFQVLVPIQPHGNRAPLFGVHAEGNVLFYRDLSLCLGENQPFYGLQSPELGDGVQHFDSITKMATSYISEIKKTKPVGPYNLCGMCFGGLIAFEIAQQLVDNGDEVNALIVFDSGGPLLRKDISPSSADIRSKFRYSRTAPLIVKVFKHWKTGRLLGLSKSYLSTIPIIYKLLTRAKQKDAKQTTSDRIKQVRLNQAFLTRQYRAKVYSGKLTFLYSEQFKNTEKTQYELALWNTACGGNLESYLVSGNHRSILEPPQVYDVAEIVGEVLDRSNLDNQNN